MRRPKIIIIGDSHTTCIAEAVVARQAAGTDAARPFEIYASRFSKKKANGAIIPGLEEKDALNLLRKARREDVFVSVLGGNQYNTLGLLEDAQPFDLIDPVNHAHPEETTARIVPLGQMAASFDNFVSGMRPTLLRLKDNFAGRVFHLNPPPPKGDNEFIKKNAEGHFRSGGKVILNVSPANMRRRLWLAQGQALKRMCDSLEIGFLEVPKEAIDENGFLGRDVYGADATHANTHYGELVLRNIEATLTQQRVMR